MANILSKSVTASSLKAKSSGILSVFYKTIDSLQEVVKSAKQEADIKQQNIDRLALEKEELMQVAQENEAIVIKTRTRPLAIPFSPEIGGRRWPTGRMRGFDRTIHVQEFEFTIPRPVLKTQRSRIRFPSLFERFHVLPIKDALKSLVSRWVS